MWTKRNDDVYDDDDAAAVLAEAKPTLSMILILDDHDDDVDDDDDDALYSNYDDVIVVVAEGTWFSVDNMMANKNDDASVMLEAVEFVLVVVVVILMEFDFSHEYGGVDVTLFVACNCDYYYGLECVNELVYDLLAASGVVMVTLDDLDVWHKRAQ